MSLFDFLVYVFVEKIARSPLGRTLRAIRDSEEASEALGKDNVAIRKKVLVIASAISAMAGALLTFYVGSVGEGTWNRIDYTFWPWLMVIMGGVANNTGVVLGGGLELKVPFIRISPEIRFTRWEAKNITDLGGVLHLNQNQAEFLIGITF